MIEMKSVLLVVVTLTIATAGAVAQATSDPVAHEIGITQTDD